MINPYKRTDIFRCQQNAHKRFDGCVSAWHVLKEKSCYPEGCIYFVWHCVLKEKGMKCIQGYDYIGKNCKGCTYFEEEKVHLQPELLLDEKSWNDFKESVDAYESWFASVKFRRLSIAGRIHQVKPWFKKHIDAHQSHLKLLGYLVVFQKGFIGMDAYDSPFYMRISERLLKEFKFRPRMRIECMGEIREDHGRVIIHKPGHIETFNKGWGFVMKKDEALVSIKTATHLQEQPETCYSCRWSSLVDVVDESEEEPQRKRSLYCLKGIADPTDCYLRITSGKITEK